MAIITTEAVILRSMPYRETSKIVTALTKDHGKLSLIARGARDTKSKYGGALELFNHISVIYYERANRDMFYISDASVIRGFTHIQKDLSRTYIAMAILEMANRVVHGNEEHQGFFELILQTLAGLHEEQRPKNGLLFFLMAMADNLGFTMDFENCAFCDNRVKNKDILRFNSDRGRLVCGECPREFHVHDSPALSKESIAVMAHLARCRGRGVYNLTISERSTQEVFQVLLQHLQRHMDELRSLQTLAYLRL